jgi:sugar phosphate permease
VTALSTALQAHIADDVRGRVMALWIMAFGGMVPIGLLAGGALASATSVSAVLVTGAVAAVIIGAVAWSRAPQAQPATGS